MLVRTECHCISLSSVLIPQYKYSNIVRIYELGTSLTLLNAQKKAKGIRKRSKMIFNVKKRRGGHINATFNSHFVSIISGSIEYMKIYEKGGHK